MELGAAIRAVRWPASWQDWLRWVLGAAVVGLIYYAYWVQVVEAAEGVYAISCYQWLTGHWHNVSNYSHGPLIPLIAIGIVWMKGRGLLRARLEPMLSGAWVLFAAMLIYYFGVKAMQPRLVVFSFVILLYGLVLTLAGREVMRYLFFPITFLLLMIPLNFLDEHIGFPLQLLMAKVSAGFLNWLGIETVRVGTSIRSAVFDFDVANPCSGIRSLMALTTVTAAFAYVTQTKQWKRWVLFLSAIPLAVLGNMARVVGIALIGQVYGQGPAMRAHDYSGFIVFGVALIAMVGIGFLLNLPYRRILESWLRPLPASMPASETGMAGNSPS
ncbi:MAG: exosortase/archaeosortase family protein [Verrucomicrobiae bacterium]|nr:exosortase/archaeosortase family protein [Verrucomicrobiae bacterium]